MIYDIYIYTYIYISVCISDIFATDMTPIRYQISGRPQIVLSGGSTMFEKFGDRQLDR